MARVSNNAGGSGISTNSFRSRLQGFNPDKAANAGVSAAGAQAPVSNPAAGGVSASNQDL